MHARQEQKPFCDVEFGCWQPQIDSKDVFRAMIEGEMRAGRLNERRRARIVRYASQMGLSAVEAGRLIAECQATAPALSDSQTPMLRFVPAPPPNVTIRARVAITTGILLLIIWLLRM